MLRRANVNVPVIMLTGADSDSDQILGLDSGANDYVTKPVSTGCPVGTKCAPNCANTSRARTQLLRLAPTASDPAAKMLLLDGEIKTKVRLTEKETSILKYLCRIGNKVVPRDVLLSAEVWGLQRRCNDAQRSKRTYTGCAKRLKRPVERDLVGDGARGL